VDARRRIGQTHGLLAKDSILNTAENRGDHLETEVSLDGFPRCLTMKKAVRGIEPTDGLGFCPEHPHGFGPDAGYPHGAFFWRTGVVGGRAHDLQCYTGARLQSIRVCLKGGMLGAH
jgi:hypothetical protein